MPSYSDSSITFDDTLVTDECLSETQVSALQKQEQQQQQLQEQQRMRRATLQEKTCNA